MSRFLRRDAGPAVYALLTLLLVVGGQASGQTPRDTAPSFTAEVTDKSGTKLLIRDFAFQYSYGYSRSNCIGACGTSATQRLELLPLNEACGAMMLPLHRVRAISGFAKPRYDAPLTATVTLADGSERQTGIGNFGGQNIRHVVGQSPFGPFSLEIEKVASIEFRPPEANARMREESWGNERAPRGATIECSSGSPITVEHATLYLLGYGTDGTARRNAYETQYRDPSMDVRIGDSRVSVAFSKIASVARDAGSAADPKFSLTMATGETLTVSLNGEPYVGGSIAGTFFYVSLKELKAVRLSP